MQRVEVALPTRGYEVFVHEGTFEGFAPAWRAAFGGASPTRAVVVTDTHVGPLWAAPLCEALAAAGVAATVVTFAAGEEHKTLRTFSEVVGQVLAAGADRRTPVVALGGGVVGDMAGFVAACALRGLPVVQVPTTLLAMVDSSVGGKTGVNHARGKNLVGAFYQPRMVWAGLGTLRTLSERDRRSGMGEVVKTVVVGAPRAQAVLEAGSSQLGEDFSAWAEMVADCVRTKRGLWAEDEREGGVRAVLNLGHTLGHGLEKVWGYGALRHGEAVALGILGELDYAIGHGHAAFPEAAAAGVAWRDRVARWVAAAGLPTVVPPGPADAEVHQALVVAMGSDKKVSDGQVMLPIGHGPGQWVLRRVPVAALEHVAAAAPMAGQTLERRRSS